MCFGKASLMEANPLFDGISYRQTFYFDPQLGNISDIMEDIDLIYIDSSNVCASVRGNNFADTQLYDSFIFPIFAFRDISTSLVS